MLCNLLNKKMRRGGGMADTEDLKSSGPKGRAGSNPALGIARSSLAVQEHFKRILIFPPTCSCTTYSKFPETQSQPIRVPDGEA